MGKPPRVKDWTAIIIGILGYVGVVFNLWKALFFVDFIGFNLFLFLVLCVFSTLFFSWLIFSNIRGNREYDKPKKSIRRKK